MKSNRLFLIAALSPALALTAAAQATPPTPLPTDTVVPPPTPTPLATPMQSGVPATHSSRVSAVVYGPQGEVQALTLRDGVAVTLSPDLGRRLQSNVTKGARVQVSGTQRVIAGQTSLVAQSLTTNGQTFVSAPVAPPLEPGMARTTPPPPPPAGSQGLRGPRSRRGPGGPPPPPDGVAPQPPPPPPPEGTVSMPPPPTEATPPPPPQL